MSFRTTLSDQIRQGNNREADRLDTISTSFNQYFRIYYYSILHFYLIQSLYTKKRIARKDKKLKG